MEPTYSLQSHIFDNIGKHVYRDINEYTAEAILKDLEGEFGEGWWRK